MDLTQVVDLVMKQYEAYTDEETKQMAELFKQLQIDVIYNAETEQVYVKSPLIDARLGQEYWVESSLLEAVGAVSYTHLDVYKRQRKCWAYSEMNARQHRLSWM